MLLEIDMVRGVVYVATGEKFIAEAIYSAASVKAIHPDLSLTLFTDADTKPDLFDKVIPTNSIQHPFLTKVACMSQRVYDETLYLDTDTYVCGDLNGLFSILERFDWGTTVAPARFDWADSKLLGDILTPIPASFPQPNTGVIVFRHSRHMESFFNIWVEQFRYYLDQANKRGVNHVNDQTPCREALYLSNLRIAAIPPEYNCRLQYPGQLHGPVHIMHGHCSNLKLGAETLNKRSGMRVHWVKNGRLYLRSRDGLLVSSQLWPFGSINLRRCLQKSTQFWNTIDSMIRRR
jgi:hypothetical protein